MIIFAEIIEIIYHHACFNGSQIFSSSLVQRPNPPLTAISNKVISYKPLKPFTPIGKPYFMDDHNPQKYFMSGTT